MAEFDHNSVLTESTALNTTLEPTTPETDATATPELGHQLPNPIVDQPEAAHGSQQPESHTLSANAAPASNAGRSQDIDPEYDADDFAAALEL